MKKYIFIGLAVVGVLYVIFKVPTLKDFFVVPDSTGT